MLLLLLLLAGPSAHPAPVQAPRLFEVRSAAQLTAAVARIGKLGDTVRLAPGEYVLKKPIRFRGANHITLIGSGWNTTVRYGGQGDALTFEDCGFCFIRDLMVVGGPRAGSGIVLRGKWSSSNTVDQCRISDFPVSGVRFEGDEASPLSSNTVSRCHFIGNLKDQLHSRCNNDFYIVRNQFGTHSTFPETGVRLERSSAGTYTMNYHWGNVVGFRMGNGCHFNRIENNRFENSRAEGVVLGGTDPWACMLTIFTGNTVHTNSEGASGKYAAVTANNVHECTFTGNQVFSWDSAHLKHLSSLVIGGTSSTWIVKDNIFRHNVGKSLVYEDGKGHIIRDNLMD